jgi:hypothetical protein
MNLEKIMAGLLEEKNVLEDIAYPVHVPVKTFEEALRETLKDINVDITTHQDYDDYVFETYEGKITVNKKEKLTFEKTLLEGLAFIEKHKDYAGENLKDLKIAMLKNEFYTLLIRKLNKSVITYSQKKLVNKHVPKIRDFIHVVTKLLYTDDYSLNNTITTNESGLNVITKTLNELDYDYDYGLTDRIVAHGLFEIYLNIKTNRDDLAI